MMYQCPECKQPFSSSGIRGHMRFKHGIKEVRNLQAMPETQATPTFPVQNPVVLTTPTISTDPLTQLEDQLTRQLRIVNLQNMIKTLNTTDNGTAKIGEIDQFTKFVEAYNSIQEKILENAPAVETDGSMEWIKMLLPLLPQLLNKNAPTPSQTPQLPVTQSIDEAYNNIMEKSKDEKIEEYKNLALSKIDPAQLEVYKTQIKDGTLKKNDLWIGLKLKYPKEAKEIGKARFFEEFDKIKNGL